MRTPLRRRNAVCILQQSQSSEWIDSAKIKDPAKARRIRIPEEEQHTHHTPVHRSRRRRREEEEKGASMSGGLSFNFPFLVRFPSLSEGKGNWGSNRVDERSIVIVGMPLNEASVFAATASASRSEPLVASRRSPSLPPSEHDTTTPCDSPTSHTPNQPSRHHDRHKEETQCRCRS